MDFTIMLIILTQESIPQELCMFAVLHLEFPGILEQQGVLLYMKGLMLCIFNERSWVVIIMGGYFS